PHAQTFFPHLSIRLPADVDLVESAIDWRPHFAIYNLGWKRTGPGGPPGLQNRLLPAHAGRLGSTPRRFRQTSLALRASFVSASQRAHLAGEVCHAEARAACKGGLRSPFGRASSRQASELTSQAKSVTPKHAQPAKADFARPSGELRLGKPASSPRR